VSNEADRLFELFIESQSNLFAQLSSIIKYCRDDMQTTSSMHEYGMLKNVLNSIIKFESQFGDIEEQLWNYVAADEDERQTYNDFAIQDGHESHLSKLLSHLEQCQQFIDDLNTEISASGWVWDEAEGLTDLFWALMDSTEKLIEATPDLRPSDPILELLSRIPAQRLAPIELEVAGEKFVIKRKNTGPIKVSLRVFASARDAISREAKEALAEVSGTNCDRRFVAYFSTLVKSLDAQIENISPVEVGIHLTVVEHALPSIREELPDVIFGRVLADVVNIKQFLMNSRDWRNYVSGELSFEIPDSMLGPALEISNTLDAEVFDAEIAERARYYRDMATSLNGDGSSRLKSAYLASIGNVLIASSREALKHLRAVASKTGGHIGDNLSKYVGAGATAWLLANAEKIIAFAQTHPFFSWVREVIGVLTKNLN